MKRTISVFIILTMLTMHFSFAFAATDTFDDSKAFIDNDINDYIALYENEAAEMSVIYRQKDEAILNIVYDIGGKSIDSMVKIKDDGNGVLKIVSTEGGITDVVTITDDGRVYLNNSEVIVSKTFREEGFPNASIAPFARRYNKVQTECPYGNPSDYSVLRGDPIKQVLTFEKTIHNFTVSAFIGVVIGLMFPSSIVGAAVGGAAICTVYEYMQSNYPNANAISCITYQYIHKTKGELIDGEHIFKDRIVYYAKKNYTVKIDEEIVYNIIKTG